MEVLKLRLPPAPTEDVIALHYDKRGLFTVKSAYLLAIHDRLQKQNSSSSSSTTDGSRKHWKDVWTAGVPQKVRVFAWRLARMHWRHRRIDNGEEWRFWRLAKSGVGRRKMSSMQSLGARRRGRCERSFAILGIRLRSAILSEAMSGSRFSSIAQARRCELES